MRYRISEQAASDLEDIWLYTFETWSIKQADKYFALLMNEIDMFRKIQNLEKTTIILEKDILKVP
ncbi:type II toxin-antitoxin system RelE/ParE family toxin [Pedobacter xixiisoli]|uniref:type II toxin-antitoxin system RelE/ParE family toxin n=1 Tax=Pedobacter xixiisoli TaxID=1476464 RepID=UPI0019807923|nr:type II toxin-antitoxin system RelE/ParE family toxin [Pedobacter xixiisoli]